ncbi:MAG: bifunctional diaminohydroxyphosphoribosylaminopyrimidine deaminase/5-amino-6-(5-phosphoribosylamino)uracil reductase RibD [Dehalococcoidia bacterium]
MTNGSLDPAGLVDFDPMQRALDLAQAIPGRVSPNPAVGAVVVRDCTIVGEGWTQPPGGQHAEVVALQAAGEAARGAQLYVTLEPCAHQGRTPPCTEAILAAGLSSVVCAMEDPDPRVNGMGLGRLRSAGVEVLSGSHEAEARDLLADYVKHRLTGLPLVTAKFVCSLDGKIAAHSGDSRWVSGPETLAWAHQERTHLDSIAVGSNTIVVDDPQLTARPGGVEEGAHQPLRVVIDTRGRVPASARVLRGPARTMIATTRCSSEAWCAEMKRQGAEVVIFPESDGHVALRPLLELLAQRGCLNLLVEGGGILLGSFFDAGLIDRVRAIIAPLIIGGATAPTAVAGRGVERMADAWRLGEVKVRMLGNDVLVQGLVPN